MKTKTLLRKIVSAGLLLSLILLVVMSCKKKDDTPIPPSPPVPPTPVMSDVFQNKPIKLMSEYEISNNLDFPGHIIHRLGKGIVGGEDPEIPNPFKKIGKTLWEVYDYKHTEMEFDKIDDGINQILGQLAQLKNQLTKLGEQLSIDVSALEEMYTTGYVNKYVTYISSAMDSTTHSGFSYYPSEARKYKAGIIDSTQMKTDTGYLKVYATTIFNQPAGEDNVCSWSKELHDLICPAVGGSQNGALKTFANEVIQITNGLNLTDTASLMAAYMLFETYFLEIVNNQFQCVMIWSNVCNYFDTTGAQANLYFTGSFRSDIISEVSTFLQITESLALNMSDFRHSTNWEADYPFNQNGLAPDFLFTHILARSQFIANLIYDGLGLYYPVMCGTIITPEKYSNEYGSVVDSIALTANGKQLTSTANIMPSQFPYAYWTNIPNNVTCNPDNNWNIYRFGKMGVEDQDWPTTAVALQVIDNGDGYYPWSHYQPCKGNVTTLFYNPQNPSQTSTSYSTTCSVQFGYFAARWNWGYQFITMRGGYYLRPQYLDVQNLNGSLQCTNTFSLPGAATTDQYGVVWQHSNAQGFSWLHDNLGQCSFSNTCINTDHYYIAADVLYCDISTSSEVPPVNGVVQMWGMSITQFTGPAGLMMTFLGSDIYLTKNNCGQNVGASSKDIVNNQFGNQGTLVTSIGSASIDPGSAYQPSMEVYYQAYNPYANSIVFWNYSMMQVVYGGYYKLSK